MKFRLLMLRNVEVKDTLLYQIPAASLGHPLVGLAVAGALDKARPNNATTALAYAQLKALGLPTGFNMLPTNSDPFSGWCLVGPNGPISFTIGRAIHRIVTGAGVSLRGPIKSKGKAAKLLPPNSFYVDTLDSNIQIQNSYLSNGWKAENLRAGSLYTDPNPQSSVKAMCLENNSYISDQGAYSQINGVSTISRIMKNYPEIGSSIATIVESLSATTPEYGLGLIHTGRFLGWPGLSVIELPSTFDGADYYSRCQFITEWEVTVDDNKISAALSQTEKIYAMTCFDSGKIYVQLTEGLNMYPGGTALDGVDAANDLTNVGQSVVQAIDITTLTGSVGSGGLFGYSSSPLYDFSFNPYANAYAPIGGYFRCSVNQPHYDGVEDINP